MHVHDGVVDAAFATVLGGLSAAYGGGKLSGDMIRIYALALSDVPLDEVRRACSRAVRDCKYMPSVAELRAYTVAPAEDAALIAWTSFCQAAETAGAWASVIVDDGIAAAALAAVYGGWPSFCAQSDDGPSLTLHRQEFLAMYRQLRRHQLTRVGGFRLPGLCEAGGPALGALATATCVWRITTEGAIESRRDQPGLPSGHQQVALPQGTDAQAAEGQAPTNRSGVSPGKAGRGRKA